MSFDPTAAGLALGAARATTGSARPDAPVVTGPGPRPPRLATTRQRSAALLHAVARRLEPGTAGNPRRA